MKEPRQSRRIRKLMKAFKRSGMMRINISFQGRKRTASYDSFPNNEFVYENWSAKYYKTVDEVREAVESFKLEGREIFSLYTCSTDYDHNERSVLYETGKLDDSWDEDSERLKYAYTYLPKKARVKRGMRIDWPFVIEFKGGDTFEIDVGMEPELRMSMNRIPQAVYVPWQCSTNPEIMFSDVIGKKISSVRIDTRVCERNPCYGTEYDKPTEIPSGVSLIFENGSSLRFSPDIDYLKITSLNRDSETKTVSWESIRHGVMTWTDAHLNRLTGYLAKKGRLMFGRGGGQISRERIV